MCIRVVDFISVSAYADKIRLEGRMSVCVLGDVGAVEWICGAVMCVWCGVMWYGVVVVWCGSSGVV